MKSARQFLLGLFFALFVLQLAAQTTGLNYQAVLRNSSFAPIGNTNGTATVSIVNAVGTTIYSETHAISTDQLGMFNLVVGKGTSPSTSFANIDWGSNGRFLKIVVSANGNTYDFFPTELQAVPYAKVAEKTGQTLVFDPATSQLSLSNGGGSVTLPSDPGGYLAGPGINISGTTITNTGDPNPADDITNSTAAGGDLTGFYPTPQVGANAINSSKVADGSLLTADFAPGVVPQSVNDLNDVNTLNAMPGQVLEWNGSQWAPGTDDTGGVGGGSTIPPLSGNGTALSPFTIGQNGAANGQVLKWNGSAWSPANDNGTQYTAGQGININGTDISATDNSATNEFQNLSVSGNQLSISNGNSVLLPAEVDGNVTNEIQQISLNGNILTLSLTGGTVTLPTPPTYTAGTGISISGGTISNTGDNDNSSSNEFQTLNYNNGILTIMPMGNQVNIPGGNADNWGNQTVATNPTLSGNGTSGSPLTIAQNGAANGQALVWNGSAWAPSNVNPPSYMAGTGISISGTTISNTGDADNSASNEIQHISITGNQVTLDNGGGTFPLPTPPAYVGGTGISVSGTTISNTGDADNSASNEIQQLSISGNQLTISSAAGPGNTVTLPAPPPAYVGGTGISVSGVTISNTGDADNSASNEIQQLSISGNQLTISSAAGPGNTVTLPAPPPAYVGGAGISVSGVTISNTGDMDNSVTNEINVISLSGNTLNLSNGGGSADLSALGSKWALSGSNISNNNSGLVGIGTASPVSKLSVHSTSGASDVDVRFYGSPSFINIGRANGTPAAPTAIVNGNALSSLRFNGYNGSGMGNGASITSNATQNWGPAAYGSNLVFSTTLNGLAGPLPRMTIDQNGLVGIGTNAPTEVLHVHNSNGGTTSLARFTTTSTGVTNNDGAHAGIWGTDFTIANCEGGKIVLGSCANSHQFVVNTATGKVGIGTDPGNFTLQIKQSSSFGLNIENNSNSEDWELYTSPIGNFEFYHNNFLKASISGVDGVYTPSDSKFKTGVLPLASMLPTVLSLQPSSYEFIAENPEHRRSIGFVAQDVKEKLPEIVMMQQDRETGEEFLTVNYDKFGVIAIKAIQEQQAIIEAQQQIIESLEARLAKIEAMLGERK